jgi:hypothetical protein
LKDANFRIFYGDPRSPQWKSVEKLTNLYIYYFSWSENCFERISRSKM